MPKKILSLWLAILCCSCLISREKYAASLRDAELAKGRLTDQRRSAQREKEQLNAQLAQTLQEKSEAEARAASAAQRAATQDAALAALNAQLLVLGASADLWRALVLGQLRAEDSALASSSWIPLLDPLTQRPNFVTSKTGLSLSAEGDALLKKIAAQLPPNNQKILVLADLHGTADDLKLSSEYSLVVTRALLAAGVEAQRVRVGFLGATQGPCEDKGKCAASQVRLVLLAEGL